MFLSNLAGRFRKSWLNEGHGASDTTTQNAKAPYGASCATWYNADRQVMMDLPIALWSIPALNGRHGVRMSGEKDSIGSILVMWLCFIFGILKYLFFFPAKCIVGSYLVRSN